MTTAEQLAAAREACAKATPGNAVEAGFDHDSDLHEIAVEGGNPCYPRETPIIGGFYQAADRDFYLVARTVLPLALDRIAELEAALSRLSSPSWVTEVMVDMNAMGRRSDAQHVAQKTVSEMVGHASAALGKP